MSNATKRTDRSSPIYVVVVEYHQHALEHIHSIFRRRKSLKPWSMLHFDAHPDLACPSNNVTARSCFLPRQDDENESLYDRLDSHSSGIAEWILPLVLAGGLKHVNWIKPPESQQLPMGYHEYSVGAWVPPSSDSSPSTRVASFMDLPKSALVRVDWKHSYYLDDASVVPTDKLLLHKTLQLSVSELPEIETCYSIPGDWALDICLDYICCRNPFLTDIEAMDEKFAQALANMVTMTRMHTASEGDAILEPANYESELARFRTLFQHLLREKNESSITALLLFYESQNEARQLLENLVDSLSNTSADRTHLSVMAMEALPNLCMPHDSKSSENDIVLEVKQRVESMSRKIQQTKKESGDPFIVTIARSTLDGFTPSFIVEQLQDEVLTSVHNTFCGCDLLDRQKGETLRPESFASREECRMTVIFDYGEREGATFDPRAL